MLYKVSWAIIYKDQQSTFLSKKNLMTIPKFSSFNIVGPSKFNLSYIGYAAYFKAFF